MSKPKYSHMISDISNLRVKKEMSGEDMTIWEQIAGILDVLAVPKDSLHLRHQQEHKEYARPNITTTRDSPLIII